MDLAKSLNIPKPVGIIRLMLEKSFKEITNQRQTFNWVTFTFYLWLNIQFSFLSWMQILAANTNPYNETVVLNINSESPSSIIQNLDFSSLPNPIFNMWFFLITKYVIFLLKSINSLKIDHAFSPSR